MVSGTAYNRLAFSWDNIIKDPDRPVLTLIALTVQAGAPSIARRGDCDNVRHIKLHLYRERAGVGHVQAQTKRRVQWAEAWGALVSGGHTAAVPANRREELALVCMYPNGLE